MKEDIYMVEYYNRLYGDPQFEKIGNKTSLDEWLQNGSLHDGDEIYKIELVGKVKKHVELIIKTEQ